MVRRSLWWRLGGRQRIHHSNDTRWRQVTARLTIPLLRCHRRAPRLVNSNSGAVNCPNMRYDIISSYTTTHSTLAQDQRWQCATIICTRTWRSVSFEGTYIAIIQESNVLKCWTNLDSGRSAGRLRLVGCWFLGDLLVAGCYVEL